MSLNMSIKYLPEAKKHLLFNLIKVSGTDDHEQTNQHHIFDINEFYEFSPRRTQRLTHVGLYVHTGVASSDQSGGGVTDPAAEKMNVAPRYWNDDLYFVELPGAPEALPWTDPIDGLPSVKGGWMTSAQLIQSKQNWPTTEGIDYSSGIIQCEVNHTNVINPITGKNRVEFSFTVTTPQAMASKPGLRMDFLLMINSYSLSGKASAARVIDHPDTYPNRVKVTLDLLKPLFDPYTL